jgi:hypothetical protein
MTLRKTVNKFQIGGTLSARFETTSGLRQGDPLATLLLNLTAEKIIRDIRVNRGGSTFDRTRQYMACADDDVITGQSTQVISEVMQEMEELTL